MMAVDPRELSPRRRAACEDALEAGVPYDVLNAVDDLTMEQRLALFHAYCRECGCMDPACQCWNDE